MRNSLRILQAHCQSPTSQRSDQSFVKELAKPKQEKLFLKNFPTLQKSKKRNTQPDTDRQKSKQTMTLKPNTVNGLQGRAERTPAANRRLAQWRVTWLIEHSTSHQLLWCIDSFVLRNPPLRQAPTVIRHVKTPNYEKVISIFALDMVHYNTWTKSDKF